MDKEEKKEIKKDKITEDQPEVAFTKPEDTDIKDSKGTEENEIVKRDFKKNDFRKGNGGKGKSFGKQGRRPGGARRGGERFKPEFDQKIIDIRRVARVVAGGRRFSFSVAVVIGNRRGSVGVGLGKGGDTALAIEKAVKNAKKNMVTIPLTKGNSLPYEVYSKYGSSQVYIRPTPGKGLVAGSSVRNVLDLMGGKDIGCKVISRSKNKLNNARAAVNALCTLPGLRVGPPKIVVDKMDTKKIAKSK